MAIPGGSEAWKKTVLRSMPLPSWLSQEGPDTDVVVSTRVRCARNVLGWKFCRTAAPQDLASVQAQIEKAALASGLEFTVHRRLSEAERDYLLGCRMISAEFQHRESNRSLLIDQSRVLSLMVNEEDHLRLQALTPGFSLDLAQSRADSCLKSLSEKVSFASHPAWGWLTSSPVNAGDAMRRSILVHLPALAHQGQLDRMKAALEAMGAMVRGVFGEASRPVGHFCQVSVIRGAQPDFRGACRYLIEKEREAREAAGASELAPLVREAKRTIISSLELSSAEAIRALSTLRWERAMNGGSGRVRQIDEWIASIELQGTADPRTASRYRAAGLRARLEQAEREAAATPPSQG